MKKLLFYIGIFIVCVSCDETQNDFHGLGIFNIGEKFTSLPPSKEFTSVMKDEYFISRFELSNKIGSVSDLNITTENGKICEVKFTNNERTSITELEKVCNNLVKIKIDSSLTGIGKSGDFKLYNSADESILFSVIKSTFKNLKNGQPVYEYTYISKEAMIKKAELIRNSLGSNR